MDVIWTFFWTFFHAFMYSLLFQEIVGMGVRRRDTDVLFCTAHLRGTVVPIREEDGARIEARLREKNRVF